MNDLLTKFVDVQPFVSILAVLVAAIYMSFKIWLQYKKEIIQIKPKETGDEEPIISPDSIDNLSHLLVQNFSILKRFYSENLSQYRTSSIASVSIAILGFIVIISGVLIALLGDQVTLGSISSAAGIVSEAAALLFFKQNRIFQEQMQDSLNRLASTQYLMTSISLTKELDGDERSNEIRRINDHLRKLMNSLHDLDPVSMEPITEQDIKQ